MPGYFKNQNGKRVWIETDEGSPQQSAVQTPVDPELAKVTAPRPIPMPEDMIAEEDGEKSNIKAVEAVMDAALKLLSQRPPSPLPQSIMAEVQTILNQTTQSPDDAKEIWGDQLYEIAMSDNPADALWNAAIDLAYERTEDVTPPIYITPQVY